MQKCLLNLLVRFDTLFFPSLVDGISVVLYSVMQTYSMMYPLPIGQVCFVLFFLYKN